MKKIRNIILSLLILLTLVFCFNLNKQAVILGDEAEILNPIPMLDPEP